jgi:hypothetical protein
MDWTVRMDSVESVDVVDRVTLFSVRSPWQSTLSPQHSGLSTLTSAVPSH